MRPILLACCLLLLASCVSNTAVYYAEGVSVSTREGDAAQCEAQAYAEYPVRSETRFTPRVFVPPQEICDSAGNCTLTPGYFEGGDPYTVDVNDSPRRAAGQACMVDRGYARVSLPRCEEGSAVQPSPVMPRLTEASCVRRTQFGPEIVTPIP